MFDISMGLSTKENKPQLGRTDTIQIREGYPIVNRG
jgi:hypothetical protein